MYTYAFKSPNCIATLISPEFKLQGRELIPQNICQVRKKRARRVHENLHFGTMGDTMPVLGAPLLSI